jgi:hypothetical protein
MVLFALIADRAADTARRPCLVLKKEGMETAHSETPQIPSQKEKIDISQSPS